MTHHVDNRQVREPGKKPVYDVSDYCRRNGIDKSEARKLMKALGQFATHHELSMNAVARPPKYR
ncbi:hypothetical protein [Ciceribacter thiooxidans]|uniref:Uncharacterized protein n=1 Tax=Ciceribacter thiooxidans TaxID=1969821 RepID=A0ABV7I7F5_9HYPH|nr:hypothetical protein [Ciceribacter thiooxidans]MDI6836845.1 hypothetical protein [Rhizobiaceae bacterium]